MESKFNVVLENEIIKITLSGNLDAKNAPHLSEELKKFMGKDIKKIVFLVKDLEYISSAGLRVIIFSKQKMGDDVKVIMAGAQEDVLDVIKMSGLDSMMEFVDTYN
jgi:anti-anti-sigma factor